jgi:hypothetical protein
VRTVSFSDATSSRTALSFTIPAETRPGKKVISAKFRALKQTVSGEYAFAPPAVEASFEVIEKPVAVAQKPAEPDHQPEPPRKPELETDPEIPVKPVPVEEPPSQPEVRKDSGEAEASPEKSERPERPPEAAAPEEGQSGIPFWLFGAIAAALVIAAVGIILFLRRGAPEAPSLEFGDQQLWSAAGDARLIGDFGEGSEVSGTPEVPESIVFRLTGTPEAPRCLAKPGPNGRLYVNRQPVRDWVELHHNTKLEIEHAGRPEVPIYKYTYFDHDPSGSEKDTATQAMPKAKRKDSTIRPEDIFPTDMLTKEQSGRELPAPSDDDELIIFDD